MKRKYLSALLMGTLTVASMSTFTSCKDYDDDISNLQEQIDKLATADQLSQKVAELQALISSNKSDITSLQSELAKKTTLDEVKAVLADYATKKYADDADATLKAALSGDIDALKAEIEKAQATANAAADDAKKANEEIQEMLTTLATKAEVAEVKTAAEAANAAIAALQTGDVATLKAKQAEILSTLETVAKQAELDEVVKKAQALEEAVAKKADLDKAEKELNAEIEKIKTTATEANKQAADNLVAIKGLDTTVKNASDALALAQANQTKLTEALESLKDSSKEGTVAATIKAIQAQLGTPNKELGTLDTRLAAIESVLNGVKDDDTKLGLATKVTNIENKLKDIIGEYTTMVTEVSLVGVNSANDVFNSTLDLKFESGKVDVKDFFFGKDQVDGSTDEEGKAKFATDAENPVKYVKDTPFNNEKAIMVRVNPTNAQLTKDMIKLVNSKGEDLSNILEIGDPKAYGGLLTKAANQTGLWSIPVKVKAGVTSDKIEQTAEVNGAIKHIAYAVAIKNTATQKDAQDRYVTSTYDITLQHPSTFKSATYSEIMNGVKVWSEQTMGKGNKKNLGDLSYYADQDQAGWWDNVIPAKNGEKINIDFSKLQDKIEYFYVVRDDNYTNYMQNSGSSEINAWNSYKYDGTAYKKLVKVEPNNTIGTLSIDINGVAGDDIAFRIFAVNRNGEVVPSTGRSFVVYVGEQQNNATVAGDITAIYDATDNTHSLYSASGWLKLNGTLKDGQSLPNVLYTTVDNKPVNFKVQYAKNANGEAASKNSEIQYAKFTCISDMLNWKDTEKAKGTISQKDAAGKMVENEISVTLTKVLPDVAYTKNHYGYTWKDGQVKDGVYTAYVFPTNGWKRASTTGYKVLEEAITGLVPGFNINIANIVKDDKNKYTVDQNITSNSWKVTVDEPLIDATTKHATKIGYNYGKISTEHKNAKGQVIDWTINVEEVNTIFACPLAKSAQNYSWKQHSVTSGETTKYYDVNVLTYGSAATVVPNVFDYIIGKNSFDNTEFGGKLSTLIQTKYLSASAKLISNGSKKEDYYTVELGRNTDNSLNGEVRFKSKSGNTNPVVDVPSTLVITLYDAFGHKMEYSLPFKVKRAE